MLRRGSISQINGRSATDRRSAAAVSRWSARAFLSRFDHRSGGVVISTSGAALLPVMGFAAPSVLVSGALIPLIVIWLYTLLSLIIALWVGRLTDSQFIVLGIGGIVGTAISSMLVVDPILARAVLGLIATIPGIAAISSSRRVVMLFLSLALVLAVSCSMLTSVGAIALVVGTVAWALAVLVPTTLVLMVRSSLQRVLHEYQLLVETDPLTGVLNRRGLLPRAENMLAEAATNNLRVAFLLIDLDNFKLFNDFLGHSAGDAALVDAVNAIQSAIPRTACTARLGGEEFIVMLIANDSDDIDALVANVCDQVSRDTAVTVSIGAVISRVVQVPDGLVASALVDKLIREADTNMYRAKALGRNTTVVDCLDSVNFAPNNSGMSGTSLPERQNVPEFSQLGADVDTASIIWIRDGAQAHQPRRAGRPLADDVMRRRTAES